MSAYASSSPSSSTNSSPATTPVKERGSPGLRADIFSTSPVASTNVSRFSVDTIAPSATSPTGSAFAAIQEEGEEESEIVASRGFLRLL